MIGRGSCIGISFAWAVLITAATDVSGQNQKDSSVRPDQSVGFLVDSRPLSPPAAPGWPSARFGLTLDWSEHALVLEEIDNAALLAEDELEPKMPLRNGILVPVSLPLASDYVSAVEIAGVGHVFYTAVHSPTGKALRLEFNGVDLPDGAELWVYSPTRLDQFDGPYRGTGPFRTGQFWSTVIPGNTAVVEYFVPAESSGTGDWLISQVAHLYRAIDEWVDAIETEGPCHNDVMCFPDWHPLHNATLRLTIVDGGTYLCSGTLLNSAANDFTPYLLTANHCVGSDAAAGTVVAYFFYQTVSCNGSNEAYKSLSTNGDMLVTDGNTDITLMMINRALPAGCTWAGWTSETVPLGTNVTCISHPDGARKKITFGTTITHPWGDTTNFFGVSWYSGTIEGGSSGSGLWKDSNQLLIGVASHSAVPIDCSNPDGPSGYGKFRRLWQVNSTFANLVNAGTDDALEPNDDCASARQLNNGDSYTGLIVKGVDEDWFRIRLNPCEKLSATLNHNNAWGDIDMELFDTCGGPVVWQRYGDNDSKVLVWTTTFDSPHDFYLRLFLTNDTRNEYDLSLAISSVGNPPTIQQHPASQVVNEGDPATFTVVATNAVTYSWRRNGTPLANGGRISGADTATLSINPTLASDAGSYDVVVTSSCASVTSNPATLTVNSSSCNPCDTNCDGSVNGADISGFVDALAGGTPGNCSPCNSDTNADGTINGQDIQGFINCLKTP